MRLPPLILGLLVWPTAAFAQVGQVPLSLSPGGAATPTIAFTTLANGLISSTIAGSGTYAVAAPSGLTAIWGGDCSGSSTVSGFSASAGAWSATFTTPTAGGPACTITATGTGPNTASATSPGVTVFAGPLDVGTVSTGVTGCWSLRACSAAIAAAGTQALINVRRVTDGIQCDILASTTTGWLGVTSSTCNSSTQGGLSPSAFAGIDASGTGAVSGFALTMTGGTIGDQLSCNFAVTPGTVIVSGASPNWTVNISQTVGSNSCTLRTGLAIVTINNQVTNSLHMTNGTNGQQPFLVLNTLGSGNIQAGIYANGTHALSVAFGGTTTQPTSWSMVAERTGLLSNNNEVISSTTNQHLGFASTGASAYMYAGTVVSEPATNSALHAVQSVLQSTTSQINVDGSQFTLLNAGTNGMGASIGILAASGSLTNPFRGFYAEGLLWANVAKSTGDQGALQINQKGSWNTP